MSKQLSSIRHSSFVFVLYVKTQTHSTSPLRFCLTFCSTFVGPVFFVISLCGMPCHESIHFLPTSHSSVELPMFLVGCLTLSPGTRRDCLTRETCAFCFYAQLEIGTVYVLLLAVLCVVHVQFCVVYFFSRFLQIAVVCLLCFCRFSFFPQLQCNF